ADDAGGHRRLGDGAHRVRVDTHATERRRRGIAEGVDDPAGLCVADPDASQRALDRAAETLTIATGGLERLAVARRRLPGGRLELVELAAGPCDRGGRLGAVPDDRNEDAGLGHQLVL